MDCRRTCPTGISATAIYISDSFSEKCYGPHASESKCNAGYQELYAPVHKNKCDCTCGKPTTGRPMRMSELCQSNSVIRSKLLPGKAKPSISWDVQHNCKADCSKTVERANTVCWNTPMDKCVNTNPYGSSASCGYGVIPSKKNKKCPNCRCQIVKNILKFDVCGIGRYDNHCNPSQV